MKERNRVFCSTGVITEYPYQSDYKIILEDGQKLSADGLELVMYPNWYSEIETITDKLYKSGLKFPVIHADKDIGTLITELNTINHRNGIDILKLNCEVAKELNAKLMVLHLWGLPLSDDKFQNNIIAFEECLNIADKYGICLAVETVPCRKSDPISNLKKLVDVYPQTKVVLDLRMISYHDLLWKTFDTDWLWEKQCITHLHIHDYKGKAYSVDSLKNYLLPGDGEIDFICLFNKLKEVNFKGTLSLESKSLLEDGTVNFTEVNKCLNYLKKALD
ncbi:sugar phosphate isomerase/epimerase family protein [Clostridium sp. FP1]|uniref:sugar phosphate isomerase/epimerase family protein n=1 Tax=Clostridium sp. FP1 TaxID=2724076 RepID=UPI0013E95B8B|nr:sugar phosphate isomerase/epimerase family protein [Clostridium sp. FP1]MBZ9635129.1 sugar phosphate isomerase/epimerase [Clostridium sp. FP1]